ncbi:MAG: pilin [bacterium]
MKKYLITSPLAFISAIIIANTARAEAPKTGVNIVKDSVTGTFAGTSFEGSYQIFVNIMINSILGIVGVALFLIIFKAGFTWMTSGDEKEINKAKDSIKWAAFGMIALFASYAIVSYIIGQIQGK